MRRNGYEIYSGANLRDSDLSSTDLVGADLRSADLSYADLRYANLKGADFSHANLTGANLLGAHMPAANFTSADLSYANLSKRENRLNDLDGRSELSVFSKARLKGSIFEGTTFFRCNFEEAEFDKPVFGRTHFEGCNMKDATMLFSVSKYRLSFLACDMRGTSLKGSCPTHQSDDSSHVFLRGSNLSHGLLQNLRTAIYSNACPASKILDSEIIHLSNRSEMNYDLSYKKYFDKEEKGSYTETHFSGCAFTNSEIRDSVFQGCSFEGESFFQTIFTKVGFMGANLKGTSFQRCKFFNVSFWGADLTASNFSRCFFENCSLNGAILNGDIMPDGTLHP